MNSMKRVGLALVALSLGAIVGASPAFAGKKYTESLLPPAVSPPEPGASGTVTYQSDWDRSRTYYTGEATVSCRGLTPGNPYDVQFLVRFWMPSAIYSGGYEWYVCETHRVVADRKGQLATHLSYDGNRFFGGDDVVDVCVRNDQGNVVLLGRDDPSWWPVSY